MEPCTTHIWLLEDEILKYFIFNQRHFFHIGITSHFSHMSHMVIHEALLLAQ